jgi:hypothetical protein
MNRPIGIHLSYWQKYWSDDLVPLIAKARDAGFDGAEFPLLDPTAMDFPRLRAAFRRGAAGARRDRPDDGDSLRPGGRTRDAGSS